MSKIRIRYYQFCLALPAIFSGLGLYLIYLFFDDIFGYNIALGIGGFTIALIILGLFVYITIIAIKKIKNGKKLKRTFVISHSLLSVILVGGIVIGSLFIHPYVSAKYYSSGPILSWGTDQDPQTQMTIIWKTKSGGPSQVWYGLKSDNLNMTVSDPNLKSPQWHNIVLSNLMPNTTYYYKIEESVNAKMYSFTTAPSTIVDFTFLVVADMRQNSGLFGSVFQLNVPKAMNLKMKGLGITPAFTVACGDVISEGTDEAMWKSWMHDISKDSELGQISPIQIAVGNHERHDNCAGDIFEDRYDYEKNPEFYYSYNYSNVYAIFVDPWDYEGCWWGNFSEVQLDWLEQELIVSQSMDFTVVFLHPPPVVNGIVQEQYRDFVDLMSTYSVDGVFFGHYHRFEQSYVDGVHYFMIGIGGNNGGNAQPPGYCQVDVNSSALEVTMHLLNGTSRVLATINA